MARKLEGRRALRSRRPQLEARARKRRRAERRAPERVLFLERAGGRSWRAAQEFCEVRERAARGPMTASAITMQAITI